MSSVDIDSEVLGRSSGRNAAADATDGEPRLSPSRIRALAAIVPAHNEQELIPNCLSALERAAGHGVLARVRILILVVADNCTDATAAISYRAGAHIALSEARNVGIARSVGAARAVEILGREGYQDRHIWLACTDADTVVPIDWFARHLEYAAAGWSAVLGTVRVQDWSARPPGSAETFRRLEAHVPRRERVHGANFGVRADAYLSAGGFPALPVGEDRALSANLRRLGFPVKTAENIAVSTSARISHRLPGGFSDYLTTMGTGG